MEGTLLSVCAFAFHGVGGKMLGRGPHPPTDAPLCSRLPVGGAVGHRHLLLVHSQPLAERRDQLPDHYCWSWTYRCAMGYLHFQGNTGSPKLLTIVAGLLHHLVWGPVHGFFQNLTYSQQDQQVAAVARRAPLPHKGIPGTAKPAV